MRKSFVSRCLDRVERVGNRLPDPVTIFMILAAVVVVASWLLASMGVQVMHPVDGKAISAVNLLSKDGIRRMFTEMVKNFAAFPPLGLVLVTMLGIGVAERTGLISAVLKRMVTHVPPALLPAALVFAGINSSLATDAGYVVLVPLGGVLFAAFGRHPIAGLAAAFAGVGGGFSANLFITGLDPLLSGISTSSAQLLNTKYVVQPTANYYFMLFSTFLLTIVGTFVTTKIVEPRLGPWKPQNQTDDSKMATLSPRERSGLRLTFLVFVGLAVAILFTVLPQDSIFRDSQHGLKPFFESLVPLIMISFLVMGLVYGWKVGTIKSDRDAANLASESMAAMGAYVLLAFVAAQFIAYFSWSNLGIITAISGASMLKAIGLTGIPLIIMFIVVSALIDLVIGSASAKWAIMGPVFVPMLMLVGYTPELTQLAYRIGDSISNIITPLSPYFAIIIPFARRYDDKIGIGTLISLMLPYSVVFLLVWTIALIAWMLLGIPIGPDASLIYSMPIAR